MCLCDLLISKINSQSNANIGFKVNKTLHSVKVTEVPTPTSARAKGGAQKIISPSNAKLASSNVTNANLASESDYEFKVTCNKDAKTSVLKLTAQFVKAKDQMTQTSASKRSGSGNTKPTPRSASVSAQRPSSSRQRQRSQKLKMPPTSASTIVTLASSRIDVDMKLDDAKLDAKNAVIKVGQSFSLTASIKQKMKADSHANDTLEITSSRSERITDAKIKGKIREKRQNQEEHVTDTEMDEDAMFIDPIQASESESTSSFSEPYQSEDAEKDVIAEGITLRIFLPPFIIFERMDAEKVGISVDTTSGLISR